MNIATVKDGVKTRLETISGLYVLDRWPDNVIPPCAIVLVEEVVYDNTFGRGGDGSLFTVRIVVGRVDDAAAQDTLDGYLAGSGSGSVKTAIEADATLSGAVDTCRVERAKRYGVVDPGGVQYLACDFALRVWD